MSRGPILHIELPDELCDQAVAQLIESLDEMARALECHYAAQLRRYYHPADERQRDLWLDDELPF